MNDITIQIVESGQISVSTNTPDVVSAIANGDVVNVSIDSDTISVDVDNQAISTTVTNGDVVNVTVPTQQIQVNASSTLFEGISDAPIDGSTYGRKDGAWEEVTAPAGDFVEKSGDLMTGDLIGTDFVKTRSGSITRDGNGNISQVTKTGGRTLIFGRDINNLISSITDGTYTWTLIRDGNNRISGWEVT